MKVLFITSEMTGHIKTGGLADVSAALPRALRARGIDIAVLLPAYGQNAPGESVRTLDGVAEIPPCEIARQDETDGLTLYRLVCPALFARDGGPYGDGHADWPDNDLRFARLSLAAAQIAMGDDLHGWRPDLLHLNDWPSALTSGYLAWNNANIASVFTIHNLSYQGLFEASRMSALGIPPHAFSYDALEFHGRLSFLKAGPVYADEVTTVSPTYAREIATDAFGSGLQGLLARCASEDRLTGIVNGIDEAWDPKHDALIPKPYTLNDFSGKMAAAAALRRRFDLRAERRPIFGIVSRLVMAKGIDLVVQAAETIVAGGAQFVALGTGEPELETALERLAQRHRGSVGVEIGFDEALSHMIVAGSDFYLMPSRFEPCGLNQMYAQTYGTIPVAHATGGLADTIDDGVSGILFHDESLSTINEAIVRALRVYLNPHLLHSMRLTGMTRDFSWTKPAAVYEQVYRKALSRHGAA